MLLRRAASLAAATRLPVGHASLRAAPSRLLSSAPVPTTALSRAAPLVSEPSRFAVMALGGTQYKVATDDVIAVERMPYEVPARTPRHAARAHTHVPAAVQVGQTVRNESVLLVGSRDGTVIGRPLVSDAFVEFTVEEHPQAPHS